MREKQKEKDEMSPKTLADVLYVLHIIIIGVLLGLIAALIIGGIRGKGFGKRYLILIHIIRTLGTVILLSGIAFDGCPLTLAELKLRRLYDPSIPCDPGEGWTLIARIILRLIGIRVPRRVVSIGVRTILLAIIGYAWWLMWQLTRKGETST